MINLGYIWITELSDQCSLVGANCLTLMLSVSLVMNLINVEIFCLIAGTELPGAAVILTCGVFIQFSNWKVFIEICVFKNF